MMNNLNKDPIGSLIKLDLYARVVWGLFALLGILYMFIVDLQKGGLLLIILVVTKSILAIELHAANAYLTLMTIDQQERKQREQNNLDDESNRPR